MALLSEMATVEFDEDLITSDALTAGIAALGFEVECVAVSNNTEFSRVNLKVRNEMSVCNVAMTTQNHIPYSTCNFYAIGAVLVFLAGETLFY